MELKPCPFCGGSARTVEDIDNLYVVCDNKRCQNQGYVLDYEVWQTRPIEDELQAKYTDLLRRVKEAVGEIDDAYCGELSGCVAYQFLLKHVPELEE